MSGLYIERSTSASHKAAKAPRNDRQLATKITEDTEKRKNINDSVWQPLFSVASVISVAKDLGVGFSLCDVA
jgi:hypothetical protein